MYYSRVTWGWLRRPTGHVPAFNRYPIPDNLRVCRASLRSSKYSTSQVKIESGSFSMCFSFRTVFAQFFQNNSALSFLTFMYLSFLVADFCKLRCFFELNTCLYFTPLCTPYFCTLRRPQENLCCLYSQHTFRIRSVPSVLENLEICTRYTLGSGHFLLVRFPCW